MISKRIKILLALLFLFSVPVTFSQQLLSLEECRNLAIENNKQLKEATAQEKVAYYNRKEAFTKYFPELSFSGMYLRNQKNLHLIPSTIQMPEINIPGITFPIPPGTEIPIPDKIRNIGEIDIKNIWVGGFNLIQPIFMGGKIVAYNDIQKYAEELAKSQKDTKLTDVIVDVDNAYWQVVSLSGKKKLTDSYVELLHKMERDIEAMFDEGVVTKADVLSVNVKVNEAEVNQTKATNGLSLAKMYLCQVCGLDISEQITLVDEKSDNLNVTEENVNVLPNIQEAFANREELKSLDLATKIYKKQEKIAFSEFLPQVGFTANYLWTNPSSFDGLKTEFGGMWSVGVSVKVPLNFFSSSAKYNAAKAKTLITQYQFEDAKEKIELQVNQNAYKVNESSKKLKMTQKNVEKADENLRYAQVGFDEGVIPASDVLAAHTAWISAHSEWIDAQIDVKLSKVYLDQSLGRTIK